MDTFKFASTVRGDQCVALTGTLEMAMLCADSWDFFHKVMQNTQTLVHCIMHSTRCMFLSFFP